jgi:hypothetical protein
MKRCSSSVWPTMIAKSGRHPTTEPIAIMGATGPSHQKMGWRECAWQGVATRRTSTEDAKAIANLFIGRQPSSLLPPEARPMGSLMGRNQNLEELFSGYLRTLPVRVQLVAEVIATKVRAVCRSSHRPANTSPGYSCSHRNPKRKRGSRLRFGLRLRTVRPNGPVMN